MSLLQLASMAKMNSSIKQPLGELPANVLETFIPGYSTIAWMVLESFSIDITTIVSITLLAFAFGRSVAYLRKHLLEILVRHGTCSIEILSDGDLYLWVMDWMADRGIGVHYPHLVAVSSNRNTSLYNSPSSYRSRHRTPSPKAKKEQRYDPAPNSTQYFWYEGRLFHWQRRLETPNYEDSRIQGRMSCVSWTTTPIKSLIDATKAAYNQKGSQKTAIRRPTPAKQRHLSMNIWKLVSMRPSRPLETVMLGSEQKDGIVSDIKEYLLPSSREWYAVRGIPYRRGYARRAQASQAFRSPLQGTLRPGRVDMRIHFELATSKQAEDLFLLTFIDKSDQDTQGTAITANDKGDLNQMALAFSAEIPEHVLSPAEIQGFLMNWKKQPAEAVAKVKEWVEEIMKEKKDKAAAKLLDDAVTDKGIASIE